MNNRFRISILFLSIICIFISACTKDKSLVVSSPSGISSAEFFLLEDGTPSYIIKFKDSVVIDTSCMGFDFKYQNSLKNNLKVIGYEKSSENYNWEMPWGEKRIVKNSYNELLVNLKENNDPFRLLKIRFRVYDDGIGFRYEFPEQQGKDSMIIMDEKTQFRLTGDHKVWWIPGDWDIYEHLYNTTYFSEIDAISKRNHPNLAQTYIPYNAVNTPVTMKTDKGIYLSFHEANLTNYPGMTLLIDKENLSMTSGLVGSDRLGYKANISLPFVTPWRTIQFGEKAKDLIESDLIVNLNEPNRLGDISWFSPMKYVGIWWEMHIGKSWWAMNSKNHGATTENAKKYIDFASENKIKGLLVEGWNTGWDHWIGFQDREGIFDFVTPYPDYDLQAVVNYAREKGVEIIMHHETSSAPMTYEHQLDTAYSLMKSLGIHSVKTGYVGPILPKGEYHHGQWMVKHYRKVIETAAKYDIAVDTHEPIKPTGLRRTYPNIISHEGLRGQEFNAWASDGGNPPEHLSIVAFTRMLAGPIDFTPGVFNIKLDNLSDDIKAHHEKRNQINTTLAQQLALYVVINSPIQMACDLPENYEGNPAFQFIRDVGVTWEKTIVLDGEIGDFVIIARQERKTGNWFIGGISDENEREITVSFDFLDKGINYKGIVYKDGADAHWNENPTSIIIDSLEISSGMEMKFKLAAGGGIAISLKKENN